MARLGRRVPPLNLTQVIPPPEYSQNQVPPPAPPATTLLAETGTFLSPGATGNQDVTLTTFGGATPKAVIVWTSMDANTFAPGGGNAIFGMGMGTFRGGVRQRHCDSMCVKDGQATQVTERAHATDALLRIDETFGGGFTMTLDLAATPFAADKFTVAWNDLPATPTIFNFIALGGTGITDAYVDEATITNGTGNLDIFLPAGFGKPEVIFTAGCGELGSGPDIADANFGFSVALKDGAARWAGVTHQSGTTGADVDSSQESMLYSSFINGSTPAAQGVLAASSSWPTDGYRINRTAAAGGSWTPTRLYLRTDAVMAVGTATIPTSPGDTALNLPLYIPTFGLFWGNGNVVNTAAGGSFSLGAIDSANHKRWAATCDVDGSNPNTSSHEQSNDHCFGRMKGDAVIDAQATATLPSVTSDLTLNWDDGASDSDIVFNYFIWGNSLAPIPSTGGPKNLLLLGVG